MKRLITNLMIVIYSFQLQSQVVQNGLQGYYNFNSNIIYDLSSNNLNGTGFNLLNAIGIEDTINSAFQFNGSSSYIDLGAENRNISDQVTLSAWIKTFSNERQVIVEKYKWAADKGYFIDITDGLASVGGRDNNNEHIEIFGTTLLNDGEWHHVLGIMDVNEWRLYVDCEKENEMITSSVNPSVVNDASLVVGRASLPNGQGIYRFYEGIIDEVRIYNRPLNEFEIDSICNVDYLISGLDFIKRNSIFLVYPNPSNNGLFVVQTEPNKMINLNYEIYSIEGKFIKRGVVNNPIDLSTLENGLFILKIKSKDNIPLGNELIVKY